jgi:hypothetical protein
LRPPDRDQRRQVDYDAEQLAVDEEKRESLESGPSSRLTVEAAEAPWQVEKEHREKSEHVDERYAGERPVIVPTVGDSEWGLVGTFRVGR